MRGSVLVLGFIVGFGGVGGCGFSSPAAPGIDAGGDAGAGSDAKPPAPDACMSFASQVDTCRLALDGELTLFGTITYDTETHVLTVNGAMMPVAHMTVPGKAGDVDAIIARNVRLTSGAGFRATGLIPFAIIAGGSVTLEGGAAIDVSNGGAGALLPCSSNPTAGGNSTGGAGGGGGAGYGAAGGDGGSGNSDGTVAPGGAKSDSIAMPMGPRGGCAGAAGGTGLSAGGKGGLGGGALYLAAADRIELLGVLTAGGGGGRGGTRTGNGTGDAGGGGGGSGGMIWLESPHVLGSTGRVVANGGGGGEGSNTSASGRNGDDGSISTTRAAGGTGGVVDGADGGLGGSVEVPTGETVTALFTGAGGGGGGGVGYVHIVSPDIQLEVVSPAAK